MSVAGAGSLHLTEILSGLGLMIVGTLTPFPAELTALSIAMLHGFWPALALIWTGAMLGAVIGYALARLFVAEAGWIGQLAAVRGARDRLAPLGWAGILGLRLVPLVPFFALSLASGLLRIPLRPYLFGTALGIVPASVILALLGNGLIGEDTRLVAVTGLALLALCGLAVLFKRRG